MKYTHCPICYEELEVRDTTPCMSCGAFPDELEHMKQGKHTYAEMEIVFGLKLVLCDVCQVDFGSYHPAMWGLNRRIGYEHMSFLRDVKPEISKAKFCQKCGQTLSFINFLSEVRKKAQQQL